MYRAKNEPGSNPSTTSERYGRAARCPGESEAKARSLTVSTLADRCRLCKAIVLYLQEPLVPVG